MSGSYARTESTKYSEERAEQARQVSEKISDLLKSKDSTVTTSSGQILASHADTRDAIADAKAYFKATGNEELVTVASGMQSHHIIPNVNMKGNSQYNSKEALTIALDSRNPNNPQKPATGSPHHTVTQEHQTSWIGGDFKMEVQAQLDALTEIGLDKNFAAEIVNAARHCLKSQGINTNDTASVNIQTRAKAAQKFEEYRSQAQEALRDAREKGLI